MANTSIKIKMITTILNINIRVKQFYLQATFKEILGERTVPAIFLARHR